MSLLLKAARKYEHARDAVLKAHGLTGRQFDVLSELAGHSALRSGDLAAPLDVTAGNITGILDRLEKRGLIHRERDSADRRVVLVRLLPGVADQIDRIRADLHQQLEEFYRIEASAREVLAQLSAALDNVDAGVKAG